ncbi:Mitochondrial protein Pet127 domain containing protein [Elaphomyces granulatus]
MFRSSLRSISDPILEHVYLSCLPRRTLNPIQPVRFYSSIAPDEDRTIKPSPKLAESSPHSITPLDATAESYQRGIQAEQLSQYRTSDLNILNSPETSLHGNTKPETPTAGQNKENESDGTTEIIENKVHSNQTPESQVATADGTPPKVSREKLQSLIQSLSKHVKHSQPPVPLRRSKKPKGAKKRERRLARLQSTGKLASGFGQIKEEHAGAVSCAETAVTALDVDTAQVPHLSYGLERVLFNPGVYHLQDPRSRVFNFDPYLGSIMPVTEFDFTALKQFITSSQDESLFKLALKEGKKYRGSSSSMTSVLSHFHYLLSAWRLINPSTVSLGFPDKIRNFTRLSRAPTAIFLRYRDGVYAIDVDKEFSANTLLLNLGKSMEKLVTLPKEEFERYRRSSVNKITADEEQSIPDSYHYSTCGDFLMRSQLDAHDPRLPGTGTFDLKSRAVVSIRMNSSDPSDGLGYEIKNRFGNFESYEREFFDMIRTAFLKYSLQVRVGRMDGIFVAFHNVERIFGFQYISLSEMDLALHGQSDTSLGDKEFQLSIALWNKILNQATARFPERSLRFHFETRDGKIPHMLIFAEPVTEEEIAAIQTKTNEKIEAYQQRILNLRDENEVSNELGCSTNPPGCLLHEVVNKLGSEIKTNHSHEVKQEPSEAAVKPGELKEDSGKAEQEPTRVETDGSGNEAKESTEATKSSGDVFALLLTIKNNVNGKRVVRPMNLRAEDGWTINFELSELGGPGIWGQYRACQKRRESAFSDKVEDETKVSNNSYHQKLQDISRQGREWRQHQDELDKQREIVVLGDPIRDSLTQ